jgi:hypothetical protein
MACHALERHWRLLYDLWLAHWSLQRRIVMFSTSLSGEIARKLISVLPLTYGIHSNNLLVAMRDRASTNNIVMRTPSIVNIGCFSHMIDHIGGHFDTPTMSDFITYLVDPSVLPQSKDQITVEGTRYV